VGAAVSLVTVRAYVGVRRAVKAAVAVEAAEVAEVAAVMVVVGVGDKDVLLPLDQTTRVASVEAPSAGRTSVLETPTAVTVEVVRTKQGPNALLCVAMAPCDVMGIRREKEGRLTERQERLSFCRYFFFELHHHHHERPPTREYTCCQPGWW